MQNEMKTVEFYIPRHESIPEVVQTFSYEETFLMIKIGCDCIVNSRHSVALLSQNEIYEKAKGELNGLISTLERDLQVKTLLIEKLNESADNRVDILVRHLTNKNDKLQELIAVMKEEWKEKQVTYDLLLSQVDVKVQKEMQREKERFEILLVEKDKQNQLNREAFEKAMQLTSRSMAKRGSDGEGTFLAYADTFKDFKDFEIVDKHSQPGQGDFHMRFEDFTILVDAKNYKTKVPSREREKIKGDLIRNEHMDFAWLVSLDSTIDKYDKSPIMFEWVTTNKCVCYINNLCKYEDPTNILRVAYYTCRELFQMVNKDVTTDECMEELKKLRETQFTTMDRIKNVRKTVREINTSINLLKKQVETMDEELRVLMSTETSNIVESEYCFLENWWKENIQRVNMGVGVSDSGGDSRSISSGDGGRGKVLSSTDIWYRFRQENKEYVKEFGTTAEKFKEFIKKVMPADTLTCKVRNGAFEVKGVSLKAMAKEKEINVRKDENKKSNKLLNINTSTAATLSL